MSMTGAPGGGGGAAASAGASASAAGAAGAAGAANAGSSGSSGSPGSAGPSGTGAVSGQGGATTAGTASAGALPSAFDFGSWTGDVSAVPEPHRAFVQGLHEHYYTPRLTTAQRQNAELLALFSDGGDDPRIAEYDGLKSRLATLEPYQTKYEAAEAERTRLEGITRHMLEQDRERWVADNADLMRDIDGLPDRDTFISRVFGEDSHLDPTDLANLYKMARERGIALPAAVDFAFSQPKEGFTFDALKGAFETAHPIVPPKQSYPGDMLAAASAPTSAGPLPSPGAMVDFTPGAAGLAAPSAHASRRDASPFSRIHAQLG